MIKKGSFWYLTGKVLLLFIKTTNILTIVELNSSAIYLVYFGVHHHYLIKKKIKKNVLIDWMN